MTCKYQQVNRQNPAATEHLLEDHEVYFFSFDIHAEPLLQGLRKITVGKNATWRTLKGTDYQNRKLCINSSDLDPYV